MPELTVLMPVHDGMPYLRTAVTSTLRALPRDAELRVALDGCTDASGEFLSGVRDRRLVVSENPSSLGVARTLNGLLADSDSRFVARMDADDICLPWRFRVQRLGLRTADIAFTSVVFIDRQGRPTGVDLPGVLRPSAMAAHLLLGNPLVHPTMYTRRAVLERLHGYDQTAAEDYVLWLRAAAAGMRIRRSAVPGLLYRRHSAQVTKTSAWNDVVGHPELSDAYLDLAAALGITPFEDATAVVRTAASGRNEMSERDWTRLRSAIRSRASHLAPAQRALLELRIRGRERRGAPTARPSA